MDKRELIESLRKEQKTYEEIAKILGVSRQRVHQIYKNYSAMNGELVKDIKKRDGFKCAICDGEINLEVHHIDGVRRNNHKHNLVTLCRECHLRIEAKDRRLRNIEPRFRKTTLLVKKICKSCAKEFFVKMYKLEQSSCLYCSRKCRVNFGNKTEMERILTRFRACA